MRDARLVTIAPGATEMNARTPNRVDAETPADAPKPATAKAQPAIALAGSPSADVQRDGCGEQHDEGEGERPQRRHVGADSGRRDGEGRDVAARRPRPRRRRPGLRPPRTPRPARSSSTLVAQRAANPSARRRRSDHGAHERGDDDDTDADHRKQRARELGAEERQHHDGERELHRPGRPCAPPRRRARPYRCCRRCGRGRRAR